MTARATHLLAAALGVMLLMMHSALAQQAAWQIMTGPDKTFTVELPAAPKHTPMQLRAPGTGTPYTMHQYLLENGDQAFVVQSVVYPKDVNVSDARATLEGALNNTARKMDGGKWATVDWVKHEGNLTAADAMGTRDGQEIRSYLVIKDRQVFTLIYAGPSGSARSDDVKRFLASLRVAP